jgi:hypothetical protein
MEAYVTLLLVGIGVGETGGLASPAAEEAMKIGASLVRLSLKNIKIRLR